MTRKPKIKPVKLFHAGPPKTATTWVFHCLKEHPQIRTSERDTIHYFDMFHAKSNDWYDAQFTSGSDDKDAIRFDPTYSYVCSPRAPSRIAEYNPDAKVIVCLRNPIERAFSHYWHIKKQISDDTIQFEDALKHYNSYATWLEHGFVGIGLQKFYDALPKDNILLLRFEDLKAKPEDTYDQIAEFAGIDLSFRPSALHQKVNVAGAKQNLLHQNANRVARRLLGAKQMEEMSRDSAFIRFLSGKSEYVLGMEPETHSMLLEICEPEIQDIERLSGLDLSEWRAPKRKAA